MTHNYKMKQIKNWNWMMLLVMIMPLIVSCSKDDDDSADIHSYIVGKWYTSHYEDVIDDKRSTYVITATDKEQYREITFNKDNTMTIGCWHINHEGEYYWSEHTYRYAINNNTVSTIDEDGNSYKINDKLYDSKQKTLCQHIRIPIDYLTIAAIYLYKDHFVYYKK